jgi:four helix bundle protein
MSKQFPGEERYSLTDQIRRSSRSVSANLAEAFRKRRYVKFFISKLTDCEGEAAETQVWLKFALECEYIDKEVYIRMDAQYNKILGMLVGMIKSAEKWCKNIK